MFQTNQWRTEGWGTLAHALYDGQKMIDEHVKGGTAGLLFEYAQHLNFNVLAHSQCFVDGVTHSAQKFSRYTKKGKMNLIAFFHRVFN